MSKQVFNDAKLASAGLSLLFGRGFGKSILWRRREKKEKYRNRKKRNFFSLKSLKDWNSKMNWRFGTKEKLLRRLQFLKYFLKYRKFFKFGDFFKVANRKVNFQGRFIFLRRELLLNSALSVHLKNLSVLNFIKKFEKNGISFIASKLYELKSFFFTYLLKNFKKYILWRYLPKWIFEKFVRVVLKRKRNLKKLIVSKYIGRLASINYPSLYLSSYNLLVSQFLYGAMFKILVAAMKADLQKYSGLPVVLAFNFIGGVFLTPNLLLRHLLYKLARLHLPTEMIPKFLYKFSGFLRRVPEQEKLVALSATEIKKAFYENVFISAPTPKKKVKYFFKHVRAFSPFLQGMFFRCNGRFTRKQDVSSFTFY